MNKKSGQATIAAFISVFVLCVVAIPAYFIYSQILVYFLGSDPGFLTKIIVYLIPVGYLLSLIYNFVNRLKVGAQY